MRRNHNARPPRPSHDEETRRLMELARFIRGATRNGYRVIIEADGTIRTEPPVPTPTDVDNCAEAASAGDYSR